MQTEPIKPPKSAAKPIDTTRVLLAFLGLVKDLSLAVTFALLEVSRIKQRRAEDQAALAKTDLEITQKTIAVEKADAAKGADAVIDDFLSGKR